MVALNEKFSHSGVPASEGRVSPDVIDAFDFTKRSGEVRGGSVVNFGVSGFWELPDASPLRRLSAAPLNRNDPETQLYYVRNRMYNPALGRWIQRDPLRYTNGANTYQFVVSNPVGNVDPTGLMTDSQFIKWLNDTYHEVPGGGEFVDATGLVPPGVKAWIYTQAEDRAIKDQGMCPPKDFLTDPIYNALMNMAQGQPLTAAEHAAVQEDYDRGARESLWGWFWGQAVKGWDQL